MTYSLITHHLSVSLSSYTVPIKTCNFEILWSRYHAFPAQTAGLWWPSCFSFLRHKLFKPPAYLRELNPRSVLHDSDRKPEWVKCRVLWSHWTPAWRVKGEEDRWGKQGQTTLMPNPWWREEGLGCTTKPLHPRPSSVSPSSSLKCVWWEKRETYQNHTVDRLSGREIEQWCLRRFRRCFWKASVMNRRDEKCFRGLRGKLN